MQRQLNIFQLEDIKPPIGSTVYFISGNKVIKAIVISHDASFAGYTNEKYFKVKDTKTSDIWSIVNFYLNRKDAAMHCSC